MRTDPTDNGGLFVGRRPGTAPVHFRGAPERGSDLRQRVDGSFAGLLLAAMIFLSLLCWGPIPLACLWLGSEADYLTGSVSLGILVAFVALFALLFGALALLRRLDNAWILVRRAAGHDQRTGVARARVRGHRRHLRGRVRRLVPRHPRARLEQHLGRLGAVSETAARCGQPAPRPPLLERGRRGPARLLPPVRRDVRGGGQRGLREEAAERKRKALTRVETLDLSQTTWPELPHPRIVNAITYVARRGLHRYPHLSGSRAARRARRAPRRRPRAPDPRQRRRRAAERSDPRADRARPAAADRVALLPAVSAHGPPRARPRGARRRRRRRAARGAATNRTCA